MASSSLSMSIIFSIFFLLFASLIHSCFGVIHMNTTLDDLCESLGRYNIKPEDCKSTLCYDPSLPCRAAHNAPALAILATKLTVMNATIARDRIKAALFSYVSMYNSTAEDEDTNVAMRSCLELYTRIIPALQWVAHSVAAGQYHGAQQVMNGTWYIANGCSSMVEDIGFLHGPVLPKENDGFGTMTYVTFAIIGSVARNY